MRGKILLFAILLVGMVSAAIIESGDAGERFAAEKADEMCKEPGVESVHICLGNTVRVVWSDESRGVTFYEPEGNIRDCPPVAPAQMGAECMQLMHPNYCPEESVCGEDEKVEFPGGTEGEIIYDGVPVEEEEEETEVITTPDEVEEEEEKGEIIVPFTGDTTTTAGTEGEAYDWLVILVVVLALVAVVLLYFAFRRTTMH